MYGWISGVLEYEYEYGFGGRALRSLDEYEYEYEGGGMAYLDEDDMKLIRRIWRRHRPLKAKNMAAQLKKVRGPTSAVLCQSPSIAVCRLPFVVAPPARRSAAACTSRTLCQGSCASTTSTGTKRCG